MSDDITLAARGHRSSGTTGGLAAGSTDDADTFRDIVIRDIRGVASEAEQALLRLPENVARWSDELVAICQDVDAQLSSRRAANEETYEQCRRAGPQARDTWAAANAEHERWRAGALRFRARVLSHQREAKRTKVSTQRSEQLAATAENQARRRSLMDAFDEMTTRLDGLIERVERIENAARGDRGSRRARERAA